MIKASLAARCALLIATCLHIGRIGVAPGTWGSLAALPLHLAISSVLPKALTALVWLALAIIGVWAAGRARKYLGGEDPQSIVVDELVGAGIAYWAAGDDLLALLVAFALFRAFDIFKPWPVNRCESLEPPGLGIMADDLAAGLLAALGAWAFIFVKAAWMAP